VGSAAVVESTVGVTGADVSEPAASEGVVTTGAGELDDVPLGDDNAVPTAVVAVVTGDVVTEVVTVPVLTGVWTAVPFAGTIWVVAAATDTPSAETGVITDSTRIRIIEKATGMEIFWSI
jgi:hypothetical protein